MGIPYHHWSRSGLIKPVAGSNSSPEAILADCTRILILIKDSEIERFISEHVFLRSKTLIHFSGSLVSDKAVGVHPLFGFACGLYDDAEYKTIPFVCERNRPGFRELFPALPNPSFDIDPGLKPLYHALCVLSGNFTTLLWQKMMSDFDTRLGIPAQAALPYLRSIVRNLESSADQALTGPIVRRDVPTLRTNLAALKDDPFQHVYLSFIRAVAPDLMKDLLL
jgi:predicted short-subunit dehydrogenase-like oxidoreductase (DUF2520 family)